MPKCTTGQLDLTTTVPSFIQYKLTSSMAAANERFGHSVSIDNNSLLIGAIGNDDNNVPARAYYLEDFRSQTSDFDIVAEHDPNSVFGFSTKLHNNHAFIGAPNDGIPNLNNYGAVYEYEKNADTNLWFEKHKFTADDGEPGDYFGSIFDLDDDRIIIGAPFKNSLKGAAYLFEQGMDDWSFQQKFVDNDPMRQHFFSRSLAIDGNRILIGSIANNNNFNISGEAFLFRYQDNNWVREIMPTPQDELTNNYSVRGDVSGPFIFVGDYTIKLGSGNNTGAVYIFEDDLIFANSFE